MFLRLKGCAKSTNLSSLCSWAPSTHCPPYPPTPILSRPPWQPHVSRDIGESFFLVNCLWSSDICGQVRQRLLQSDGVEGITACAESAHLWSIQGRLSQVTEGSSYPAWSSWETDKIY